MTKRSIVTAVACLLLTLAGRGPVVAQTPAYTLSQDDAVTGDNPPQNFSVPGVTCTGCRLPDTNGTVDIYTQDIYERPTASGSSANTFYAALDITTGLAGFDATYLYYRINLYGNDTLSKPLPFQYAFEINFDADPRGDLLVRSEDPSGKVGGTWGTSGVIGYWDQNNNVGDGQTTLPDGPGNTAGGYETLAFDQGSNNAPGGAGGATAIVARVVAGPALELAVRRVFMDALKGSPVTQTSFRPYAAKSGSTTSAGTLYLHDEYGRLSGGSPYPWLALAGAPGSCPNTLAAENALTAAQRAALDSGSRTATAFLNPCYPSGGNIVEFDNGGSVGTLSSGTVLSFEPPTVAKSFAPADIGTGDVSVLTITLTAANSTPVTGVAFTDSYPAGLVNATPLDATNTCGGTLTAAAGGTSVALSGGSIPGSGSCAVTIEVTGASVGAYVNSTGAVTTANAGTASAAQATLTIRHHPTIVKSFDPDPIAVGGTSQLTITLGNTNAVALTGAAFTDLFPITPGAMTLKDAANGNTCGGSLTDAAGNSVNAGDVGIRLTGGTIPAGGSCVITVNVTAGTAGLYTNTIAAGDLTTTNAGASTVAATDTLTVGSSPSLTVVKSVQVETDPLNGATNPKSIPGATEIYSVVVTNTGSGSADADSVVLVDPIPVTSDLFVGDLGGAGSGPVQFVDGSPSSGLTYTFTALGSTADDLAFSSDGGTTFTYVPAPDANGYDAAVTHVRVNPKGTLSGSGGGDPSFTLRFRIRLD